MGGGWGGSSYIDNMGEEEEAVFWSPSFISYTGRRRNNFLVPHTFRPPVRLTGEAGGKKYCGLGNLVRDSPVGKKIKNTVHFCFNHSFNLLLKHKEGRFFLKIRRFPFFIPPRRRRHPTETVKKLGGRYGKWEGGDAGGAIYPKSKHAKRGREELLYALPGVTILRKKVFGNNASGLP